MKELNQFEISAVSGGNFHSIISSGVTFAALAYIFSPLSVPTSIGRSFVTNPELQGVVGGFVIGAGIELAYMGAQALDSYFYSPKYETPVFVAV